MHMETPRGWRARATQHLKDWVIDADDHLDGAFNRFNQRFGRHRPRHVAAYRSVAGEHGVELFGRLLAEAPLGGPKDDDGWWVETATGELIGPDPEIERPLTSEELAKAVPLAVALPDLAEAIKRGRGRPKTDKAKEAVTLRLSPETVAHFKAIGGADWRARMSEALERKSRAS